MNISDITSPSVCIVAMVSQLQAKEIAPHMHMPYYQATIDPRQSNGKINGYSPSKAFIRFGLAQGDELNGWQPASEIEIMEIIYTEVPDEMCYPMLTENELESINMAIPSNLEKASHDHQSR